MRVVSFVGYSESGKTTLIAALIRHFVAQGQSVAAIKHTHHPLNTDRRGDTARFQEAGADPVILAGDAEAILHRGNGSQRIEFAYPRELLEHLDTSWVLVEGWKRNPLGHVIWLGPKPITDPDQVTELAAFLAKITG